MRSLLIAFLILTLPLPPLHSTSETQELTPSCGGPFQLCGYREKDSKTQRIPLRFEIAQPFHEGLAAVRIKGQYGYVDPQGKVVIAPQFQAAGAFSGGYAEVRVKGASGIIDRAGRLNVPTQFNRIIPFHNGTFIAEPFQKPQSNAPVDDAPLTGFPDLGAFVSMRGAGLYSLNRGWLTEQNLQFAIFDVPERGLIWAGSTNDHNEEIWGLLKSDGSWKVSPRYNHVQNLNETHAVVHSMPDYKLPPLTRRENILWGAVDRNGDLVVPMKFKHLSYWRGGYGRSMDGKPYNPNGTPRAVKEGIVRFDGSLLAGRYFDEVDIGEDGLLPRGRIGRNWYSIEPNGRLVQNQLEGKPLLACENGLAIFRRGDMAEFRRFVDGKPIGRFDMGYFNRRDCPVSFSAKRGDKWFIIMADGKVLGGKKGFDNSFSFTGTHTAVEVDGKWGVIDRSGKFSVKPRFAKLRPSHNGAFMVGEGDSAYWISATGKRVAAPVADKVDPGTALTCQGGLQFFEQEGLWGLRDESGKAVIAPQFRALSCFNQGISWAAASRQNAWCPIGPDGSRRTELECREGYYPMFITHHSPEKFNDDPFESSVLWVRAWLDYNAGKRNIPPKWIPHGMGHGSYSGMEGGPVGPERRPMFDKILLMAVFVGLSIALVGYTRWRKAPRV